MNRRLQTLIVGAVPVVGLAALIASPLGTVPFASEGPGPLVNVLEDVEGEPAIEITGAEVDSASEGKFDLTTVAVTHGLNLPAAIAKWADPEQRIVPIETVFPSGMSQDEVQEQNLQAFTDSEANATAAALDYLQLPMEVVVAFVDEDSVSAGKLEDGDVLVRVGGEDVTGPDSVRDRVMEMAPGDSLPVEILRDGKEEQKEIVLGENPDDSDVGFLGIGMSTQPGGGMQINYNVTGIGGPSAGLIITLGVIDKLSDGDLTGGKAVAGTGTIDASGSVGEIGGITHKITAAREAGIEMFLVPSGNCSEATTADAGDMTLYDVSTLDEAIHALENPESAPTCSG